MATGQLRWEWQSALERGSALAVADRFILWGEHGHLAQLEVNSRQALPWWISDKPLLATPCYAAPALHRGLLFLRNETTVLCLQAR